MRHFRTKKEAKQFRDNNKTSETIFKKLKGHKNRVQKPFVVCSFIAWLNLD